MRVLPVSLGFYCFAVVVCPWLILEACFCVFPLLPLFFGIMFPELGSFLFLFLLFCIWRYAFPNDFVALRLFLPTFLVTRAVFSSLLLFF